MDETSNIKANTASQKYFDDMRIEIMRSAPYDMDKWDRINEQREREDNRTQLFVDAAITVLIIVSVIYVAGGIA